MLRNPRSSSRPTAVTYGHLGSGAGIGKFEFESCRCRIFHAKCEVKDDADRYLEVDDRSP